MTADQFRDLALRVLEGTADANERARLAQARADSAEFSAEWETLSHAWHQARAVGPALAAVPRPPERALRAGAESVPPAPIEPLLERTVHANSAVGRRSSRPRWISGAAWLAAGVALFLFLERRPVRNKAPDWLEEPWPQLAARLAPEVTRGDDSGLLVLSPAGATSNLTPLIDWTAQPGKTYRVVIAAAASPDQPVFVAGDARPPLEWSAAAPAATLQAESAYVISVAETGRPLVSTQRRFVTLRGADARPPLPEHSLDATARGPDEWWRQSLFTSPPRTGDAWGYWRATPPAQRTSDRMQRYYLVLTAQLGWEEEFRRVAAEHAK